MLTELTMAQKAPLLSRRRRWYVALRPCGVALALAFGAASVGAQGTDEPAYPLPELPSDGWEGAIGLNLTYRPEFQGASKRIVKPTPIIFLRRGRLTLSSGGSRFATRRSGDVARGLGLDVVSSEDVRISLGLRYDGGRDEDNSGALAGTGDIPPTLRARLAARWRIAGPWQAGASWSVDAFGRGGGSYGDLTLGWERRLSPRSVLSVGTSLGLAGKTYMQAYYGINAAQAAASGREEYYPEAGLRELNLTLGWRHDFSKRWVFIAGAGVSRLLGPAASSPLTEHNFGWGLNTGAVLRF